MADRPITAFITWAHGDQEWEKTIAAFAFKLREFEIEAEVDLFHLDSQDVDWSTFGPQAIEDNDFVLLAVSHAYRERWEGRNDPRQGAGVAREANVLKALFDEDQAAFRRKVKVVLLPAADPQDVPAELRASTQRFTITTFDREGFSELLNNLKNEPRYRKAPLGTVSLLPEDFVPPPPEGKAEAPKQAIKRTLDEVKHQIDASGGSQVPPDLTQKRSVMEAALDAIEGTGSEAGRFDEFIEWHLDWLANPSVWLGCVALGAALAEAVWTGAWGASVLIVGALVIVQLLSWAYSDQSDRVLPGVPAALGVAVLETRWLGAGVGLALVAGVAAGTAVATESSALWLIVLGLSVYALLDDGGSERSTSGKTKAQSTATATTPPMPSSSPTVTSTPTSQAQDESCTQSPLKDTERETANPALSNQTAKTADGPLSGGGNIAGKTGTRSDQDWLFFCAAGGPTTLRLLVPDDDDEQCSELQAEVQNARGRTIGDEVLQADPGSAVTARETLREGWLYRVRISHPYGELCRWHFGVGPPGAALGDPAPPTSVSCLPSAETSHDANRRNGFEPNERIDEAVVGTAPRFAMDGTSVTAVGRISSATDQEWFAFCSRDARQAVTVTLNKLDYSADFANPRCTDVSLALLDGDGNFQDNADPVDVRPGVQQIPWTTAPDKRYYIWIAEDGSDRCRWRLRLGPVEAITDTLPLADWNG